MHAPLVDTGPVMVDHEGLTIPFPESGPWPTWIRVDNREGPDDITVLTVSDDPTATPVTDFLVMAGVTEEFEHGPWDGGSGFRTVVLICAPGDTARVRLQAR